MGLFDTYVPRADLACPVCASPLRTWQGTDGPSLLLTWREGELAPIDAPDIVVDVPGQRLPPEFHIYSHDCACDFPVIARCSTQSGVWSTTRLLLASDVDSALYHLPRERRAAWKAWLQRGSRS